MFGSQRLKWSTQKKNHRNFLNNFCEGTTKKSKSLFVSFSSFCFFNISAIGCPTPNLASLSTGQPHEGQIPRSPDPRGKSGSLNSVEKTWNFQIFIQQLNPRSHTLQSITKNKLKSTIPIFQGLAATSLANSDNLLSSKWEKTKMLVVLALFVWRQQNRSKSGTLIDSQLFWFTQRRNLLNSIFKRLNGFNGCLAKAMKISAYL